MGVIYLILLWIFAILGLAGVFSWVVLLNSIMTSQLLVIIGVGIFSLVITVALTILYNRYKFDRRIQRYLLENIIKMKKGASYKQIVEKLKEFYESYNSDSYSVMKDWKYISDKYYEVYRVTFAIHCFNSKGTRSRELIDSFIIQPWMDLYFVEGLLVRCDEIGLSNRLVY